MAKKASKGTVCNRLFEIVSSRPDLMWTALLGGLVEEMENSLL